MSRNAAGTYTLPLSSVVAGTVIDPAWANTTLADLATEMTDSLSRSGEGAMLATLQGAVGALGGTGGFAFTGETNTGLYRAAAGDLRLAVLGADRVRLGPTASDPAFTVTSPQAGAGTVTDFLFNTSNTRSAGKLFALQNNASNVLTLGPAGVLEAYLTAGGMSQLGTNFSLTLKGNRNAGDAGTDVQAGSTATRSAGGLFGVTNNGTEVFRVDANGGISTTGSELSLNGTRLAFTEVRLASDQTDSSGGGIALATLPVVTNGVYEVECTLIGAVAAGPAALNFNMTHPGATSFAMQVVCAAAGTTVQGTNASGTNVAVGTVTSKTLVTIRTLLVASANGNLVLNMVRLGGASTATVYAGSIIRARRSV